MLTKEGMIYLVLTSRDGLIASLNGLTEEQLMKPDKTFGEWSVKQVLDHIAYWDSCIETDIQEVTSGRVPFWADPNYNTTESNERVVKERAVIGVHQTIEELRRNRRMLDRLMNTLSARSYTTDYGVRDQRGTVNPYSIFLENAQHDGEHAVQILLYRMSHVI